MGIEEEKEYLKNTLKNYYYLKKLEKEYEQQLLSLEQSLEYERPVIKAMKYECNGVSGSGCSVNMSKEKSPHAIVNSQMKIALLRDDVIRKYQSLDRDNRLTERISRLNTESQIIINNIFQREMTMNDVATIEGVSKQCVSKRLNNALEEMIGL